MAGTAAVATEEDCEAGWMGADATGAATATVGTGLAMAAVMWAARLVARKGAVAMAVAGLVAWAVDAAAAVGRAPRRLAPALAPP